MPLASVIVPAFNAEQTLANTLESLRHQTLGDFEIIVIDDGSTDATASIASAFPDPRIRVFSLPNGGLAAARNRGLERANGRYVSFLDADDMWTADKLEAHVRTLKARPGAVVSYSWTAIVDADGRFLFAKMPCRYEGIVHRELLVDLFIGSGSNVTVDRERVSITFRFDESLRVAEDWDFLLRLAREHEFAVVPRYQVLYRLVVGSLSSRVREMEKTLLRSAEREFAAFAPSLDSLRPRTEATIREFIATQCLLRGAPPLDLVLAARMLAGALRSWPRRALQPGTWFLAATLVLLSAIPAVRHRAMTTALLRGYGRLQRTALPALGFFQNVGRRAPITDLV